ncbi:MAG: hypothetical protein Q8P71_00465 [bacterium]|nr:hypothetical protein [bacterium]
MAKQEERKHLVNCIHCGGKIGGVGTYPHSCPGSKGGVDLFASALKKFGIEVDAIYLGRLEPELGDDFPWALLARGEENLYRAECLISAYNRSIPADSQYRWVVEEFFYYKGRYREERWRLAPAQKHLGGAGIKALTQPILTFLDPEHDPAS